VSDITASTVQLQGTSGLYQSIVDQIGEVYQVLTARLAGEGLCWGNDEPGIAFGDKYVPAALAVLSQLDNTHQGVQSMVDGIAAWAKNYVDATAANVAGARQIGTPEPFNPAGVHAGVSYAGGG
jgi:hypothetical protein